MKKGFTGYTACQPSCLPPDISRGHRDAAQAERIFVGLGTRDRRDGGVGLWLAEHLALRGIRSIQLPRNDAGLLEALDRYSDVVLLDACQSGQPAGHVARIDAAAGPVPTNLFRHMRGSLGSGEIVEAARTMGCLPPKLLLIGIEGQDFSAGNGLTPLVEWSAARLLDELSAPRNRPIAL